MFLANYGDMLTDAPLNDFIGRFQAGRPDGRVPVRAADLHVSRGRHGRGRRRGHGWPTSATRTSGSTADTSSSGRRDLRRHPGHGEELVEEPFARLPGDDRLATYRYDGFWAPMDTLKEAQMLQALYEAGEAPWTRWLREPDAG